MTWDEKGHEGLAKDIFGMYFFTTHTGVLFACGRFTTGTQMTQSAIISGFL